MQRIRRIKRGRTRRMRPKRKRETMTRNRHGQDDGQEMVDRRLGDLARTTGGECLSGRDENGRGNGEIESKEMDAKEPPPTLSYIAY